MSAPQRTEITFTLPASQAEAYTLISDLGAIGRCLAGVKSVTVLSDEDSEWRVEVRAGVVAQTVTLRARMLDRRPPESLAFSARGMNIELEGQATLRTSGPRETEVQVVATVQPRGPLAPLIDLVMRRTQQRLVDESVQNIKRYLESRTEAPGPA